MARILVTGSRDWRHALMVDLALREALDTYGYITIVHGDCPTGADSLADRWAKAHPDYEDYVHLEAHPAPWEELAGFPAGQMRNAYMVGLGADLCLAFIHNESRGASGCAAFAKWAGIPVWKFTDMWAAHTIAAYREARDGQEET